MEVLLKDESAPVRSLRQPISGSHLTAMSNQHQTLDLTTKRRNRDIEMNHPGGKALTTVNSAY